MKFSSCSLWSLQLSVSWSRSSFLSALRRAKIGSYVVWDLKRDDIVQGKEGWKYSNAVLGISPTEDVVVHHLMYWRSIWDALDTINIDLKPASITIHAKLVTAARCGLNEVAQVVVQSISKPALVLTIYWHRLNVYSPTYLPTVPDSDM